MQVFLDLFSQLFSTLLWPDPRALSYDDDGDPIAYDWSIASKPSGSIAEITPADVVGPTFIADAHGVYVAQLSVFDGWEVGTDTVVVSFENVKPVADAGVNQSVLQGSIVYADGSQSHDANLDSLTYKWSIASMPEGSAAILSNDAAVTTGFVADLSGNYVISLIVNDGFVDSEISNITVTAISYQDATTVQLQETQDKINALDPNLLKNSKMQNALIRLMLHWK